MEWLIVGGIIAVVWFLIRNKSKNRTPKVASRVGTQKQDRLEKRSNFHQDKPKTSTAKPTRWIPSSQSVDVCGYNVPGMVYVGTRLRPLRYGGTENCLINPSLAVSRKTPDRQGHSMPYWPSYTEISPSARSAYLEWHATGRAAPDVGIGYIFLFFYGLERRVFVDQAMSELPAILSEVDRLLSIYGENGSFSGYARRFKEAAAIANGELNGPPVLSPEMRSGYEMGLPARLHLGRRLAAREPLTPDDALLWILSVPDTRLRTPATRCFDELCALWRARFAERYPNGLKVAPPKSRLKVEYRAASGTFDVALPVDGGSTPDISSVSAPLDGLRDLLNACTDDLDSYSRLLGRRPDAKGSAEALALLPKEVVDAEGASAATDLRSQLDALFADRWAVHVPVESLLEVLDISLPSSGKVTATMAGQIGACLDKLDVGFEPDRRYGPTNLSADGRVVLFKASEGGPVDGERATYQAARTMVEVSALAAVADGQVTESEFSIVRDDIRNFDGLDKAERLRLSAHSIALMQDAPRHQAVMKRLAGLQPEEARRMAQTALSAVLADGHADATEVKFLEKLHKALGLPPDEVYSSLHRGHVAVDEPVSVSAEQRSAGEAIPPAPPANRGVQIDEARLARIRSETSAVSSLLAGIFVEDEEQAAQAAPALSPASGQAHGFPGLDAEHGELLAKVFAAGGMGREAFEDEARRLRLLPDGAIETINEWGFDTFDEPVLEDDDEITVAEHIRPELERLEAAE